MLTAPFVLRLLLLMTQLCLSCETEKPELHGAEVVCLQSPQ